MKSSDVVYFVTDSGRSPVEDFIRSLHVRTKHKFFNVVGLLEHAGKKLLEPHAKYVGDDLYELRFKGQEGQIRILYFFYVGNVVVLVHGFIKKTAKLPQKEKKTALQRKEVYLVRLKRR